MGIAIAYLEFGNGSHPHYLWWWQVGDALWHSYTHMKNVYNHTSTHIYIYLHIHHIYIYIYILIKHIYIYILIYLHTYRVYINIFIYEVYKYTYIYIYTSHIYIYTFIWIECSIYVSKVSCSSFALMAWPPSAGPWRAAAPPQRERWRPWDGGARNCCVPAGRRTR